MTVASARRRLRKTPATDDHHVARRADQLQSFNIAAGETTVFSAAVAQSVVLESHQRPRIPFANLRQPAGQRHSGADEFAGFYSDRISYVKTAPHRSTRIAFRRKHGRLLGIQRPAAGGSIVNFGKIDVGQGGPAYLIAEMF